MNFIHKVILMSSGIEAVSKGRKKKDRFLSYNNNSFGWYPFTIELIIIYPLSFGVVWGGSPGFKQLENCLEWANSLIFIIGSFFTLRVNFVKILYIENRGKGNEIKTQSINKSYVYRSTQVPGRMRCTDVSRVHSFHYNRTNRRRLMQRGGYITAVPGIQWIVQH